MQSSTERTLSTTAIALGPWVLRDPPAIIAPVTDGEFDTLCSTGDGEAEATSSTGDVESLELFSVNNGDGDPLLLSVLVLITENDEEAIDEEAIESALTLGKESCEEDFISGDGDPLFSLNPLIAEKLVLC